MRIFNVKSNLTFNTIMARMAPNQSGEMGFIHNADKSITIFAVEHCDVCGCECQGANPITIDKARQFVIDGLIARNVQDRSNKFFMEDGGCDDEGNFVCYSCYAEGHVNRQMLKSEGV
jgi:hypothetical protein